MRERDTRACLPGLQQPCKVLARLHNHPAAFRAISAIKADAVGRLVTVRGTVVRATPPAPLVVEMEFVCGKCGGAQRQAFPDGRFSPPGGCAERGCRSRTFQPVRANSTCIDWQRVGLQVCAWEGVLGGGGEDGWGACEAWVHTCRRLSPASWCSSTDLLYQHSPRPCQGPPRDEQAAGELEWSMRIRPGGAHQSPSPRPPTLTHPPLATSRQGLHKGEQGSVGRAPAPQWT